jgi:hypothetical protein
MLLTNHSANDHSLRIVAALRAGLPWSQSALRDVHIGAAQLLFGCLDFGTYRSRVRKELRLRDTELLIPKWAFPIRSRRRVGRSQNELGRNPSFG